MLQVQTRAAILGGPGECWQQRLGRSAWPGQVSGQARDVTSVYPISRFWVLQGGATHFYRLRALQSELYQGMSMVAKTWSFHQLQSS
jgi:hypothetical protein